MQITQLLLRTFAVAGATSAFASAQCLEQQSYSFLVNPIDLFGWSVDVDNNWAAISYIGDDYACPANPNCNAGAVNVYQYNGSNWPMVNRLQAIDGAQGDEFGQDVDISGDRIIVGAHFKGPGAAYVFVYNGSNWVQEQKLEGSVAQTGFHFGHSVTLAGDTAYIGSMGDNHAGFASGSAYVFVRSGGAWQEVGRVIASDPEGGALFGRVTMGDENTFFVSALMQDEGGLDRGAVYVFERDDNGTPGNALDDAWNQVQKIADPSPFDNARFGRGMALDAGTLVVGSPGGDVNGIDMGRVETFVRSGALWVHEQTLVAHDGEAMDSFGTSVAIHGDRILVGANLEDEGGMDAGAMYTFERANGPWVQTQKYVASDASAGAGLGDEMAVALFDDKAIVGARFHNISGIFEGTGYFLDLDECLGESYCMAQTNTTGQAASMSASGTTLVAANNLTLHTKDLPLNQFGIYIVAVATDFVVNPGGTGGNLCVGTSIGRYNAINQILISGTTGEVSLTVDLTSTPSPFGLFAIQPGETWYFQTWFRDLIIGTGSVTNFSSGLEVMFH